MSNKVGKHNGDQKMTAHKERGYTFQFRSGGVVVLKGHIYIGFFETLEQALIRVFGG